MNHVNAKSHLVVIRISDSSAMSELEKKVRETADAHRSIPGAATLKRLGAKPLQDPDAVSGRLTSGPGFRAVVFQIPGTRTRVLMALGSATKVNLGEDDNAFVQLLASTLKARKVESVWVADFARLLRSIDYLSDTWKAVRTGCRFVRHGGAVIDTTSPTAEIAFLFEALSAAADARSVIKRTLGGKMRAHADGRCPVPKHMLPLGYAKTKNGHLRLRQPALRSVIRTIVQVLGDPLLTNAERVRKVADAGGHSSSSSRRANSRVRVDELNNPSATVARWYRLLETWATGTWVFDQQIPDLLSTTIFDLPVEIRDDGFKGRVWRQTYKLPLPPEGWATEHEFRAARRERDARTEHDVQRHGKRKPFCDLPPWNDDIYQYVLMSRGENKYELRRRPVDQGRKREKIAGEWKWVLRGWGRAPNKEGEVIAVIDALTLHRTVTERLVDALVEGLTVHKAAVAVIEGDEAIASDLRKQIGELRRQAANARRNSIEAETEVERRSWRRDASNALEQAETMELELLVLTGVGDELGLAVDADALAEALAAIGDQADHVPGQVADAFRLVLSGFRLTLQNDECARWESSVVIGTASGVLTVGPATGEVAVGTERSQAARRTAALGARAEEACQSIMSDGLDAERAAARMGLRTPRRVAQTARDHLQSLGLEANVASFMVSDAVPAARAVMWERLQGRPYPAFVSPHYGRQVETILRAGDRSHRLGSQIRSLKTRQTAVVDTIVRAGGWVSDGELDSLCEAASISLSTLDDYTFGRVRNGKFAPAILRSVHGGRGLLPCPHCDAWADLSAPYPEVVTDVLCRSCMRMPVPDLADVVFPMDYKLEPGQQPPQQ
jgi:hypothetical protein